MPNIPAEQRPAVTKVIAPAVLFWFRWGAMATIVTGLILAWINNYLVDAITIGIMSGVAKHTAIGIGMWLGTIMWFNVWFVIWPAQKKIIGALQGGPAADAALAPRAALASKVNTYLSVPLLLGMVSSHNYAVFGGGLLGLALGVAFCLVCVWLAYTFAPKISTKLIEG
jgi:uncharacterized membrane protein